MNIPIVKAFENFKMINPHDKFFYNNNYDI